MISANVFVWILTGLFAGCIARIATRTNRDYGVIGDLVTGSLGALIGGWLMRELHILTPPNIAGHVLVALVGAVSLLFGIRLLRGVISAAGLTPPPAFTSSINNFEALVRQGTEFDRRLITKFLKSGHTSRDVNQAFASQLTIGEQIADRVAAFGGSWSFIGLFLAMMIAWMAINEDMRSPFDPYPYILLNLILSCLAALQAPIIMMSQNRQAARDRLEARNDFEVNLRAEMEIMALHGKLDQVRANELLNLNATVSEQLARLSAIEAKLTHLQSDL